MVRYTTVHPMKYLEGDVMWCNVIYGHHYCLSLVFSLMTDGLFGEDLVPLQPRLVYLVTAGGRRSEADEQIGLVALGSRCSPGSIKVHSCIL